MPRRQTSVRLQRLLLTALFLILPAQLGYHWWPDWSLVNGIRVDYLSPTLYLTDIVLIALLALDWKQMMVPIKSKLLFVSLLVPFAGLNIWFSKSPEVSIYAWLRFLEYFIFVLYIVRNTKLVKETIRVAFPFMLSWVSILAISQWVNRGSLNGLFYWIGERSFTVETPGIALSKFGSDVSLRPYATLPHPNALAGFLLVGLILLKDAGAKNILFWMSATLVSLTFVLTESVPVYLVIGTLLTASLLRRSGFLATIHLKRSLLLFVVFLSLLSPLIFLMIPDNLISGVGKSNLERIELSILSGDMIVNSPLVGVGLGGYITQIPHYLQDLPSVYRGSAVNLYQPAHNVPLLIFSEVGAIGLFVSFLSIPLILASPLGIGIFIISLFDHYWVTLHQPILLLCIWIGLATSEKRHEFSNKN